MPARLNPGGCAQLRLEGVDALELHFEGGHQHLGLAVAARDALLAGIGFETVEYPESRRPGTPAVGAKAARPEAVPGHILTRGVDSPRNARPVAVAFVGPSAERDGSEILWPKLYRRLARFFADGGRDLRELWMGDLARSLGWTEATPSGYHDAATARLVEHAREAMGRGETSLPPGCLVRIR